MEPVLEVVRVKDIAARAKLSRAAVSYALRNDSKISLATRERVQALARELGYRPNTRVASLMAHIRRSKSRLLRERIAFVWVHTTRAEVAADPFLQRVFSGARARAEQAGFALEEFWTSDRGMNDRRLHQIIRTRGIMGVILSPVTNHEATLNLDWDWGDLASAVIGNATWSPELHHAGHHHYLGMRQALTEVQKLGCVRPAALLEPETNERAKRAWEAAFLTHHPDPAEARSLVRMVSTRDAVAAAEWLRQCAPDALIVSNTRFFTEPAIRKACQQHGLARITLHWNEETPRGIGGIHQCYDRVAAYAVDLVVAQLNNNESGVPDLPRMMLFPGRWIPATKPGRAKR